MKTMAEKLKEILSSQSQEEFLKDWSRIEALGLEGPNALEYIDFIEEKNSIFPSNKDVYYVIEEQVAYCKENNLPNEYALAA